MNALFSRNDARFRLLRTIIQGVIGVIIANLDVIIGVFLGLYYSWPVEVKAIIVALVMAILSPIMAEIGIRTPEKRPEIPEDEDIPDAD